MLSLNQSPQVRVLLTLIIVIAYYLVVPTTAKAQEEVSGQVNNEQTGEFLPGVNISVKGTTQGTFTDAEGNYSLTVPSLQDTLVVSFIGFQSREIPINDRSEINIQLQPQVFEGEELVVVGYGEQSEREVTGAVSSVDMEEVNEGIPNINITQSLSGVPGAVFTGNGRPGQGGDLLIRGKNSLSGDNDPLIVLDGIIFNGELTDINPQDIKTMQVLKDASSTAIYGSRAANGVILVTSKEGTTEKPSIDINLFSGLSEPSNEIELLSAERYIERRLDWRRQSGLEANPENILSYLSPTEAENYQNGISHNPWDIISQQGKLNSFDLSVSGRADYLNYYFSASYSNDVGLIYNDDQKRNTLRANIDLDLTDWFKMGTNTTYSHRNLSGVSADVSDAYRNSPLGTWYYPDGSPTQYPVPSEQASNNPVRESILSSNNEVYDNLFSNIYADLEAKILNGQLGYRVNYSPNLRWNNVYNYVRQDEYVSFNNTSADKFNQENFDWVLENILTYRNTIGKNHAVDLTFLYSRRHSEFESTTANADLLSIDGLGYNNLELGSVLTNNSYAQNVEGVSYLGRLNYKFKDRYLLTLTARRDGSSVFSLNNKYATFPSGALAWIISDERFMESADFIDFLKFRISYGAVGNQAIEPYQSLSLSGTTSYVFGNGGDSSIGLLNSTLGNNNLKWETTYTTNAAIDFAMFDGRIDGKIDIYNSNTEDLLIRRNIPVMNGFSSILTNIGQTNNKGIEAQINTINLQKDTFSWSTSASFAHNKNEIVHLFRTDVDNDGGEDNSISNSWFIGEPIDSYYDYVFDGIYQEGDPDIPTGSEPGFVRVKDINQDGRINSEDRQVVTSGGSPDYQISLTNRFNYKNLSLSVLLNSMLGWEAPFNLINPLVPGRSLNQIDAGWWTRENQSNSRPSLVYSNPLGTNWYSSRDFVRIKDISLAYQFDQEILDKIGASNLRLSFSIKNLYTFTNWLGTDPENGGDYLSEQGSDDLYPMPRTYTLGLKMGF